MYKPSRGTTTIYQQSGNYQVSLNVMPAKAGVHQWIPAFAGMTGLAA